MWSSKSRIGITNILALGLLLLAGINPCAADFDIGDDLDTLNFDVFQETAGKGLCPTLMDPDHGRFDCVESRGLGISRRVEANKTCTLRCKKGYALPLVRSSVTGKSMLLEETGVYKCFSNNIGNRRQWTPSQFFDCTPRKDPMESKMYFMMTLTQEGGHCDPDDEDSYAETFRGLSFDTNAVCHNMTFNCTWGASVRCLPNTRNWKIVITLSWPFNVDFLNQRKRLLESFANDVSKIQVKDQLEDDILQQNAFQVVCPTGTRFARDLICHGCSKGNFMNATTMLCQICPPRFFQDQDLQVACKPCPSGSTGSLKGGTHITSCFKMHELLQETDLLTMTFCLGTVISVLFALIIFNSHVQKEGDDEISQMYYAQPPPGVKGGEDEPPPTHSIPQTIQPKANNNRPEPESEPVKEHSRPLSSLKGSVNKPGSWLFRRLTASFRSSSGGRHSKTSTALSSVITSTAEHSRFSAHDSLAL